MSKSKAPREGSRQEGPPQGSRSALRPASRPAFHTFAEFYPFYLGEHTNTMCRRLHFTGTTIVALLLVTAVVTQRWWLLALAFVTGYAFAWVGHFFFEHNRPATFKYPLFSFIGDWRLWWDILTGRQHIRALKDAGRE